jgi:hypothetical protein
LNANLRKYLAILALGPCLAFAAFAAVFLIGHRIGALATLDQAAVIQVERAGAIFLPFDIRYNGPFKLRRLEREKPQVVWFGSSRAATAAQTMFKQSRFYNMSFVAWTTKQLLDVFERSTRTTRPRVAVISLDYFMFTDAYEAAYASEREMLFDEPWRYLKSSVRDFITAAMKHRDAFRAYARSPGSFVGTQAILSQEGFRSDGSYVFSPAHIEAAERSQKGADFLIRAVPGAPQMSERQKAHIVELAALARARGITMIAVQLPIIRAAVDYMDRDESFHHYAGLWREFESEATREWLAQIGITFLDFARSDIDADRANFIDALHPSESGMLKVMDVLLPAVGRSLEAK